MAAGQMGLQPMLSPHSGALLLPALQQNAAAAVAAFAAAAAAAHQQQQQQQQHGTAAAAAAFMAGSSPVLMAAGPFQRVARLKVKSWPFSSYDLTDFVRACQCTVTVDIVGSSC